MQPWLCMCINLDLTPVLMSECYKCWPGGKIPVTDSLILPFSFSLSKTQILSWNRLPCAIVHCILMLEPLQLVKSK